MAIRIHEIGIYCIKNTCNGHCYIGQSGRIPRRFTEHKTKLRKGRHRNQRLQKAWTEFGEESFEFSILEKIPYSDYWAMPYWVSRRLLLSKEKTYIDNFHEEGVTLYNHIP